MSSRLPSSGVRNVALDDTALIHAVGRRLTVAEDLAELADVLDLLVERLGAGAGLLLTFAILHYEPLRFLVGDTTATPVLEALVTRARDSRQSVFAAAHDPRWRELALPSLGAVGSALAVPVQAHSGQLIGVLAVAHAQPEGLTRSHEVLLTAVAYQMAAALRQARLANEVRRRAYELSVLDEIGQAFASLDLEPLLRLILKRISRTLRVNRSALFMHDEASQELVLRAVDYPGSSDEVLGLRIPLFNRPHVMDAIYTRQPVEVQNIYSDPRWRDFWPRAQKMGLESSLAVPLIVKGQAIGAISMDRTGARPPFTPDEISLCQIIANQAASAIENARLYGETRRYAYEARLRVAELDQRAQRLALLNRISTVLSTSLDVTPVAPTIVQEIAQALNAAYSSLTVFAPDGHSGQIIAIYPAATPANSSPVPVSLDDVATLTALLQADAPTLIQEAPDQPALRALRAHLTEQGIQTLLMVPLVVANRVQGLISLDATGRAEPLSPADLELAMTIGNQVAFALANAQLYAQAQHRAAENARLYQEAQRRADQLRLINEVSKEISSILNPDLLLWSVVRLIRETLDCYHVAVGLVEGDELVFKADVGYLYQESHLSDLRLRLGGPGITAWVAEHGVALLVPDVTQDSRYLPAPVLAEACSEVAVPLKLGERTIGVLDAQSSQIQGFDESDLALLQSLAAQVAVAVENARLFSTVQDERAKLEAILNGAGDVVIVTDEARRVLLMNHAAEKSFHVDAKAAQGRPLAEVVVNPGLQVLWQASAPNAAYPLVGEVTLADGRTLYASLTAVPHVGLVAVMQDISHLKELDRMKSEFVSTVSHDLRSPLQAIQLNLEVLPRMGPLNANQKEAVASSLRVLERITNLVRDLLDLGRIEAGVGIEKITCSVAGIITMAVEGLRPRVRLADLHLTTDLPADLPDVRGDPNRLAQVVANLVDNAIKYTPAGGQICVKAGVLDNEVRVEVQDTGPGIPAASQARLFEKFYRLPGSQLQAEGSGLGLAIVKSIVEAHGGRVWVESSTEPARHGSTFGFAIPLEPGG